MRQKLLFALGLLVGMNSPAAGQAQAQYSLDALAELDRSQELVDAVEAERGRYAQDLIEPLEQLAAHSMALNQFDEADAALDRAIQITRFNDGLHTPAQLSLITKRIDNFSNRKAWDDAREQMTYLFEYYHRVPVSLDSNLLEQFATLADQHLRGAEEDLEEDQGPHLSRAYQLNQAMIVTAKKLHGEQSLNLVPYLYRQVLHMHIAKKSYDKDGRDRTNANFYYTLKGSKWPWKTEQARGFHFNEGMKQLEQIEATIDRLDPPDSEAQAMIDLYIADWQNLFDFAEEANVGYENAYAALLGSDASAEQIHALFAAPRVLPIQQFYTNVEAATASTASDALQSPAQRLDFSEWTPNYPGVPSPLGDFSRAQGDSDSATIEFKLAAQNESTFLFKHRYKYTIGTAYDAKLVERFACIPAEGQEALTKLEHLRFRPKMLDGVPAQSLGLIRYEVARGC